MLPLLGILPLQDILKRVIGDNLKAQTLAWAKRRQEQQAGRTAAKALARTVLKGIQDPMAKVPGSTVEQRIEVGRLLKENVKQQLAELGDLADAIWETQAALERGRGTAAEATLRTAREDAEARWVSGVVDLARVSYGQNPRG
jgi:hypothetical protein